MSSKYTFDNENWHIEAVQNDNPGKDGIYADGIHLDMKVSKINGSFLAEATNLPGLRAIGATEEEAMQNIMKVVGDKLNEFMKLTREKYSDA
jgi:hypothetical protein